MTAKILVQYSPVNSQYEFIDWFEFKFNHNVVNSCKYEYKLQLIREMAKQGISTNKINVIAEKYVAD